MPAAADLFTRPALAAPAPAAGHESAAAPESAAALYDRLSKANAEHWT
jgi:hypothetical protein